MIKSSIFAMTIGLSLVAAHAVSVDIEITGTITEDTISGGYLAGVSIGDTFSITGQADNTTGTDTFLDTVYDFNNASFSVGGLPVLTISPLLAFNGQDIFTFFDGLSLRNLTSNPDAFDGIDGIYDFGDPGATDNFLNDGVFPLFSTNDPANHEGTYIRGVHLDPDSTSFIVNYRTPTGQFGSYETVGSMTLDIKSIIIGNPALFGDFDLDDDVDADDIDLLSTALLASSSDLTYDLDLKGTVDSKDKDAMIEGVLCSYYGDANLDKQVNIGDLTLLAGNFGQNAGWASGDFSGDGLVNIGDLTMLAANFGQGMTILSAVPEPASLALLALMGPALIRRC